MMHWLKDHCVPHAGNDFRPHLLQKVAFAGMLGLVVLSFALANLQALLWLNVDWLISAVLPAVVVEETNAERAEGAIGPLRRNATLDRAAQLKAEHMAEVGYFAHYAPDGTSPWHWFRSVNYSFVHAGENLAVHFNDSQEVVEAWMQSPTHRANIMNRNYNEIGIGVAKGEFEGHDTVFVVQMFGTPAAIAAAPPATAPAPAATPPLVATEPTAPPAAPATNEIPRVAAAEESSAEPDKASETVATTPIAVSPSSPPEPPTPTTLPAPASSTPIVAEDATVASSTSDPATTTMAGTAAEPPASREQFMATTTNAVPAPIADGAVGGGVGWLSRFATSPQLLLQSIYLVLGALVVGVLGLSLVVEFRRQHPVQVAYTLGLLAVMGGLYFLQTVVTTGATIALVG